MSRTIKTIVAITFAITFIGCASYVVPKPGKITLEDAMRSVGQGIVEMRKAQGEIKTGLFTDEVVVVFNISATGEQGGKIYLEMSPIVTSAGKAGGELSGKYTALRGNQITIKFKNLITSSTKDTLLRDDKISLKELIKFIMEQTGEGPTKAQQ
jgi:hypothetical protein